MNRCLVFESNLGFLDELSRRPHSQDCDAGVVRDHARNEFAPRRSDTCPTDLLPVAGNNDTIPHHVRAVNFSARGLGGRVR